VTAAGFFRGTPRRRPPARSAAKPGRFRRGRQLAEEYAARWVQAVTLALLCGSLIWLLASSLRLVRAHFLADYGQRAWLLPLGIGILLLVLLYRLVRFGGELRELRRALRNSRNSLDDH
jgi:hypothetical protein